MAETMTVSGVSVPLSHTDKVFFPDDGITKGDLVGYYRAVAGRMLPYLRQRPIAMARYPDGIGGQRIFQKNVPGYFPGWITRAEVKKQGGVVEHVICDKAATLVYLANQGCIEPHVFLSLLAARHPDVTTTEQRKDQRHDRVYLDIMRNSYAQTVVAPYAVRARPGAPVATPLHWHEVEDEKLSPASFTLRTIPDRLAGTDDPWAGMSRKHYGLVRPRQRLARL